MMDHPNIARVFDGGITEQGRPYFAMELVRGLPVTEYCDQRRMTVRDRLLLFTQICHAVQHAHQKGIIHRDIKPGNVLVTEHDGQPVPKVIDFGLAKALGGAGVLTEHTLYTAFGQMAGTPLYTAPEQVAINALDIDTRADIYALGVLLYELFTGSPPLDRERLKTGRLGRGLPGNPRGRAAASEHAHLDQPAPAQPGRQPSDRPRQTLRPDQRRSRLDHPEDVGERASPALRHRHGPGGRHRAASER